MLKIEYFSEDDFERIFVFGDLHGRLDLFELMLEKIKPTKRDLLIILGDSCDRGKDSIGLYLKFWQLLDCGICLKHILGNHEKMMLDGYFKMGGFDDERIWRQNGGTKTKSSIFRHALTPIQLSRLKRYMLDMPHILISQNSIYVHAGYDGRLSQSEQNEEFVLWNTKPFAQYNQTGKEIYFGHLINDDNEIHELENGVFSMDVGAFYYKRLVIMEKKSKQKFDVSVQ